MENSIVVREKGRAWDIEGHMDRVFAYYITLKITHQPGI